MCEFRGALDSDAEGPSTDADPRLASAALDAIRASRFFAAYELLEEIARGGMGIVFKARHIHLNRIVALKMISSGPFASDAFVERFKTEAEAAARLDHPNIVPIYEVGQAGGHNYLTMKFVEGVSLAEAISGQSQSQQPRSATGSPTDASTRFCDGDSTVKRVQLAAKIARAVHYAHQRGILHRDLKPGNILLGPSGEPYVADFGLAKILEKDAGLTVTDAVFGTAGYMAPEQASGGSKEVTTSADVYSLGAILYELLTGQPPFQGETPLETMRRVVENEPVPPSRIRPAPGTIRGTGRHALIDRDLETICLRCLEKEPARRYGSAEALAEDLERWTRDEPILARPPSTVTRARKWMRRRPAVAALIGAVAGLLIAIAIGASVAAIRIAAANAKARRSLYIANMNLAQGDWEAGNTGRLIALLEETKSHSERGFEWHYWNRRLRQERFRITAHEPRARSVAFSSDGRLLLTSGDDTVKIWSIGANALIPKRVGFTNEIWRATFSPNARYIGTSGETRPPEVWNASTGQRLFGLAKYDSSTRYGLALAFAPDEKQFVRGMDGGGVEIVSLADGRTIRILSQETPLAQVADWSENGNIAVGFRDRTAMLWNLADEKPSVTLQGHRSYITAIRFSPDEKLVATGSNDNTVKLWDASSGQELFTLRGHSSWIVGLAFSPAGDKLVSCGDQTPKVWSPTTGEELFTLRGHSQTVRSVAFAPDGQTIATASLDGTVRFWDSAPLPDPLTQPNFEFGTRNLAFLPDSRRLAFATVDRTVRICDASSGKIITELPVHDERIRGVAISADGKRILTLAADGIIRAWNTASRDLEVSFSTAHGSAVLRELEAFSKFGYCPATDQIAIGINSDVRIYSARDGTEVQIVRGRSSPISALNFSDDGKLLAVAHENKSIRIWHLGLKMELQQIQTTMATEPKIALSAVVFSRDATRLLSCGGEVAELWDVSNGSLVTALSGHRVWVMNAAFAPDGRRVATGGTDGTARIWDTSTGRELLRLDHGKLVFAVAFSPDGHRIASGALGPWQAQDATVKIWNALPE